MTTAETEALFGQVLNGNFLRQINSLARSRDDKSNNNICGPPKWNISPPTQWISLSRFAPSFMFLHLADACISKSINSSVAGWLCGRVYVLDVCVVHYQRPSRTPPRPKCICCKWPCLWAAGSISVFIAHRWNLPLQWLKTTFECDSRQRLQRMLGSNVCKQ